MGILGRNFLHTAVSNFVLKFVVGLTIGVVTSRALGPAGRGEYNLLVLIITLVTTLFNFGVPGTNVYFTAQKKFGKEKLYRASAVLAAVISVASFAALYLLYRFDLFYLLFPTSKLSPTIVASLAIIPIVLFNLFAQGVILGENKIVLNNYITLSGQGALAVTLTILYFTDSLSVTSAIVLYALSHLFSFVIIAATSFPTVGEVLRSKIRWADYRTMLGYSLTIHLGNLAQFFNYRLDAFIVNYFLGTSAVGLYLIASTLGETLWLFSASMASVIFPTIAGQHEKSREIAIKGALGTLAISSVGGGVAFLAGPILIPLLFGEKFIGSIDPFFILIPGVVIFSITNVISTYLAGTGNPRYSASISFVAFLVTVVLDIALIPTYGIIGAAIASTISYSVSSLLTVLAFFRVSGMTPGDAFNVAKSMSHDVRSIMNRLQRNREA